MSDSSSDSDSDDGFLEAMRNAGANTKSRRAEKTVEERLAMLERALKTEDKNRELQTRIMKLKQEKLSDDRVRQAEGHLKQASTSVQRRQETYNAIHGIENDDDGLTPGKRTALTDATDTDKSSLLGTRRTLRERRQPIQFYSCSHDAITVLKEILMSKELKNHAIGKRLLVVSSNVHILTRFLQKPLVIVAIMKKHRMAHLPPDLSQWLFFLACNCDGRVRVLSEAAFKCLEYVWKNTMEPDKVPFVVLADLETHLRDWFGLTTIESLCSEQENKSHANEITQCTASSLRHWLILWGILLQDGLVCGTDKLTTIASRCVVALARVGLDPLVHNSGQGLLKKLQYTFQALVYFVSLSIKRNEWKEWIQTTASLTMQPLLSYGPGSADAEDGDDHNAYLCLALSVRLFPPHDDIGSLTKANNEFKAALTTSALQHCTGIDYLNTKSLLNLISKEPLTFLSMDHFFFHGWRALVISCAAFFQISKAGKTILMDGPRILATVEVIVQELLVGLRYFSTLKAVTGLGIYTSKKEAGEVAQLLEIIEHECSTLTKQMGRLSSQPHFRRAECHLSNLRGYVRQTKDDAIQIAGIAICKKVQSSLNQFLGISDADSDNNDTQEDQSQIYPEDIPVNDYVL